MDRMEIKRKQPPMLWTRVTQDVQDSAQRVADREFDGNLSMLVRVAVKRLIAERAPELVTTDTDLKVA